MSRPHQPERWPPLDKERIGEILERELQIIKAPPESNALQRDAREFDTPITRGDTYLLARQLMAFIEAAEEWKAAKDEAGRNPSLMLSNVRSEDEAAAIMTKLFAAEEKLAKLI